MVLGAFGFYRLDATLAGSVENPYCSSLHRWIFFGKWVAQGGDESSGFPLL